jgi:hypothetical protein
MKFVAPSHIEDRVQKEQPALGRFPILVSAYPERRGI